MKPSQITQILSGYKKALDESQKRYETIYLDRAQYSKEFYNSFFKDLIKDFNTLVNDPAGQRHVKGLIVDFFGSDDVRFAAIDGTCYKDQMADYIVFFAASYGVRGQISFYGDPPKVKYEKWSTEQDVSMVAYVPIPYVQLNDVLEDQFVSVSDVDKINLSFIHTQLMQLAEIFLAYDFASSATLRPKLILLDQSMSSVMASTDIGTYKIDLIDYTFMGRGLTRQDIIIAYSHPYDDLLQIPSKKKFRIYNYVLSELQKKSPLKLLDLSKSINIPKNELLKKIHYIIDEQNGKKPIASYNPNTDEISLNSYYQDSWQYVVGLFENICTKLFKDKDQSALIYKKQIESGEFIDRWMSPNDLRFLIAVGIRALIETCWKHNILLVGIIKDSSSRYLSRNYLGVMRHLNKYDFKDILLPWTDRTFLEILPLSDENLQAPWSTIEFDSTFMTLHLEKENNELQIKGVKGDVVTTEGLFLRSLAQFYLNRSKSTPLTGHVIFIDRLAIPNIDKFGDIEIYNDRLGTIKPITYINKNIPNNAQDITMYLLNILTRNLYPEVIGYPDPLHKADWGAKSLYKKVKKIIDSSGTSLKAKPLNKTFRSIRDSFRRI